MQPCSLLSLATAVPPTLVSTWRRHGPPRFGGGQPFSTGCRVCSTMRGSPGATSSLRPNGTRKATAGTTAMHCTWRRPRIVRGGRSAAIDKAGLTPNEIDGVVTVSTTGIATPSLEARVGPRLGLRAMCAACRCSASAAPAGSMGWRHGPPRRGRPGSNWLFVTVETCSISIRLDSDDPAAIVATALFGDGAAAAVVKAARSGLRGFRLGGEIVARHVADHGLGYRGSGARRGVRSRNPAVHRGGTGGAVDEMWARW